jgi:hypothetical protein
MKWNIICDKTIYSAHCCSLYPTRGTCLLVPLPAPVLTVVLTLAHSQLQCSLSCSLLLTPSSSAHCRAHLLTHTSTPVQVQVLHSIISHRASGCPTHCLFCSVRNPYEPNCWLPYTVSCTGRIRVHVQIYSIYYYKDFLYKYRNRWDAQITVLVQVQVASLYQYNEKKYPAQVVWTKNQPVWVLAFQALHLYLYLVQKKCGSGTPRQPSKLKYLYQ